MAKRYFAEQGISYEDIDVSRDRSGLKEMVMITGQYAVPVILVGDKAIVGWSREEFRRMLQGQ